MSARKWFVLRREFPDILFQWFHFREKVSYHSGQWHWWTVYIKRIKLVLQVTAFSPHVLLPGSTAQWLRQQQVDAVRCHLRHGSKISLVLMITRRSVLPCYSVCLRSRGDGATSPHAPPISTVSSEIRRRRSVKPYEIKLSLSMRRSLL